MFQFRRFPSYGYLIHHTIPYGGFPHSEISGSKFICNSPKLIAAYHVLHRLLMPRHSPCALISLTSSESASARSVSAQNIRPGRKLRFASLFLLPNSNPLRWALNLFLEYETSSVLTQKGTGGEPPELKHLSRARKRHQPRFRE